MNNSKGMQHGALLLTGILAGLLVKDRLHADPPAAPADLRAHHLEITDNAGKAAAVLEQFNGGPTLRLSDTAGADRLLIGLDKTGIPYLSLRDPNGKRRVGATLMEEGQNPVLVM